MVTYKCKNCGAQLNLSDAGGFTCSFCGCRAFMSDSELRGNDEFRKKIISYYKARAIEKENDYSEDNLWEENGIVKYEMDNSQYLTISYMDKYEYPRMDCYLAMKNIVYVFQDWKESDIFINGLKRLVFPEADVKLNRCFPELKNRVKLKNGMEALVFVRKPFFYPVEVFAPLQKEHLAWVISRMENICCEFEYAEICHGDISPSSVLINPVTHEGMLFGDWRNVGTKSSDKDLRLLRETAKMIMTENDSIPELTQFLKSVPKDTAFADFEYWDSVIEKGFGGHKFIKM